ncbi:MAG: hypothetical protein R3C59_17035 [Planctomycetaceae bacterium]
MPDPLLYLKSMTAAAIVSAVVMMAMVAAGRAAQNAWRNSACVIAVGTGLAIAFRVQSMWPTWPPVSALDRLVLIVLPIVLSLELLAGFRAITDRTAWSLRIVLAVVTPRILLHGSVYLDGSDVNWTMARIGVAMAISAVLLVLTWRLLVLLSLRSEGPSIPFALAITLLCGGASIMLAGYIKGGAAAFPFAATLSGVAVTLSISRWRRPTVDGGNTGCGGTALIGIGLVTLFSLLFIGRFFGRLSTVDGLVLLLTPLLCWVSELTVLKRQRPWMVGTMRLLVVAVPLTVVVVNARLDFDRRMGPLLLQKFSSLPSAAVGIIFGTNICPVDASTNTTVPSS